MKIKHENAHELQIIQQFIHIQNGEPTLTTWFRSAGVKQKVDKPVIIDFRELQKLQTAGFIAPEYQITNFR